VVPAVTAHGSSSLTLRLPADAGGSGPELTVTLPPAMEPGGAGEQRAWPALAPLRELLRAAERVVAQQDVPARAADSKQPATGEVPSSSRVAQAAPEDPARRRHLNLQAAILHGAVRTLDRYCKASTGLRRAALERRYRGTMAGVGLRVGKRAGALRVLEVYAGSGARQAGLQVGDGLSAVEGRPVSGHKLKEVLGWLRGEPDTRVRLTVARGEDTLNFDVLRSVFRVPRVRSRLLAGGKVGWIRLSHLSRSAAVEVGQALLGLGESDGLAGVILDLRRNSGGSMLAAAAAADLFVREGLLTQALDRRDRPVRGLTARIEATPKAEGELPLAVLMDARTASSAELLAAALAFNDRALLVGSPTFGKTRVLKVYEYPSDDLSVRLSVATMRAAGQPLPEDGLTPDVTPPELADDDALLGWLAELLLRVGHPSRATTLERIVAAPGSGEDSGSVGGLVQ